MHGRQKHGVFAGALVVLQIQRDGFVDDRANPVTHVATQAPKIQAGFMINQHRQAHAGVFDVGQRMVQRAGRAGFDARNVLAHLTRLGARHKKRRASRHRLLRRGQLQDVIRTITHTQPTANAGTLKIQFGARTRRANGTRWQGNGLLADHPQAQPKRAHAARHLGGVQQKLTAISKAWHDG
jgi:hypothetical protein